MLITFFRTVTREMLGCAGDAQLLHFFHIGFGQLNDLIRIIAVSTGIDDRISPVGNHVADRCEGPVAADRTGFFTADSGHIAHRINGRGSGAGCAGGDHGAFSYRTVAAGFTVCRDQNRDPALFRILVKDFHKSVLVAYSAAAA